MNYKLSIFTYLDILGFRDLVGKASAEKIGQLLAVLRKETTPDEFSTLVWAMSFLTFSDCTIRAVPIEDTDDKKLRHTIVSHEIFDLAVAQCALIREGHLLRGAITIGDICFGENTVFGPALIDAYRLESEFAVYPRIIIDPAIFKLLDDDLPISNEKHDPTNIQYPIRQAVRCDSDGIYFIDYLTYIVNHLLEFGDEVLLLGRLWEHKHLILNCCQEHKGLSKIAAKYLWLATYHNTVVREIGDGPFAKADKKINDYLVRNDEFPLVVAS